MSWSMDRPIFVTIGGPASGTPRQLSPGTELRAESCRNARRLAAKAMGEPDTPPSAVPAATSPLVLRKSREDRA